MYSKLFGISILIDVPSAEIVPLLFIVTIYLRCSPAFTLAPSPSTDSNLAFRTASLPVFNPILVAIALSSIFPVLMLFVKYIPYISNALFS